MRPVLTLSAAAIMLMVLVSALAEGSKLSSAVMPMGTVRWQNDHLTVSQLLGLLRCMMMFLLLGRHEHGSWRARSGWRQGCPRWRVHGLAAGDDSVRSQVGEHGLQALTGGNGHKAVVTAGVHCGVNELAGLCGGLFSGGLLFQALALLLAGQELLVHVLDLEVGQVAVLDGLAQDLAGVSGVDMQVDDIVILDAYHAVAVGFSKGAHLCGACASYLLMRNWVQ